MDVYDRDMAVEQLTERITAEVMQELGGLKEWKDYASKAYQKAKDSVMKKKGDNMEVDSEKIQIALADVAQYIEEESNGHRALETLKHMISPNQTLTYMTKK
jgi:hypothetical protein